MTHKHFEILIKYFWKRGWLLFSYRFGVLYSYRASLSCLATVSISLAPLLSSRFPRSTPNFTAASWAASDTFKAVIPTCWTFSSTFSCSSVWE